MVNHFKDANKTQSKTKSNKTTSIANEGCKGNLYISYNFGVVRIFEIDSNLGKVLFGIVMAKF